MDSKKHARRIKGVSNCFNCGWRTPLNNSPEGCVLGMRTKSEIKEDGYSNCDCDKYVMDTKLIKHISDIVGNLNPPTTERGL